MGQSDKKKGKMAKERNEQIENILERKSKRLRRKRQKPPKAHTWQKVML